MKKRMLLIGLICVFAAEMVVLIVFAVQTPNFNLDTVAVNEVVQSVTIDFDYINTHSNSTDLDYVVLDNDGNTLYRTKTGLSESINSAIAHRDTMLDLTSGGVTVGKIIIYNDGAKSLQTHKQTAIIALSILIAIQCAMCIAYAVYIRSTVIKPFSKLKGFAERIACGNLDIPLEMDKYNLFGAFTESFDIMRSELKKSRIAEALANASKKELVAKLSHDIKTPVASIKAVSEVGLAVCVNSKDRDNYTQIIGKADQINTLISNLFTATLEELQQLTVSPTDIESAHIKTLLVNADYMRRANIPDIPDCLVYADALRLQQVFDNIFANSYKYANTDIGITSEINGSRLTISLEDFGGGVAQHDLPVLKEKYKRGNNAENIEGAGLGLYIADYFVKTMGGELDISNGANGLKATVILPLSGNN